MLKNQFVFSQKESFKHRVLSVFIGLFFVLTHVGVIAQTLTTNSTSICLGETIYFTATINNCSWVKYYEISTDGVNYWKIIEPANGCTDNYTPTWTTTFYFRYYWYRNPGQNGYVSCSPVTVSSASVGGGVYDGTTPICLGSSTGTMSLSGQNGSVVRWEKRVNAGAWSTISNTSITYSENPSSAGTWEYRAVVKNGGCPEANSSSFSVTVILQTASITGSPSINIGGTTQLTPNPNVGGNWVSNNPSVASVVQRTGVVTGLSAGSATFTFTADYPVCSATTPAVTVNSSATTPTVTSFSPTSACSGSGTSVVITGTNFTGTTVVNFYNSQPATYTVNSATQITATLPAGATTGPISVTTPSGTGTSSSDFTVNSVPSAPSTTGALICVGSTATLSASGAISGQFYKWYDAASGGNLLKTSIDNTDNTYTTLILAATTNYWVSILSAAGCEGSRTPVTATFPASSPDDQNTAGTNYWIGHVYKDYVYGNQFTDYFGYYTESSSTFNQLFGGGTNCFTISSSLGNRQISTNLFSVRLRMNYTSDKGLYVINLGSDDGSRLTIDGTLVHNNWGYHGWTSIPNVLINLTSNSSLVYEYFENQGNNRITFQSLTLILSNTLSANTSQSICLGNSGSAISGDEYGTLPTGITLSGTGYQWAYSTSSSGPWNDISGATSATYTPSTASSPFNSAGTYYVIRKAILSSTNNVSPSPYIATNESNVASFVVTAYPTATASSNSPQCEGTTINLTGGPDGMSTYSWIGPNSFTSNLQSPAIINATLEGSYTLTVTDGNGCSNSASTTIVLSTLSTVSVGGALSAICQGETTAALGGSFGGGATGAIWSDGSAGGTFANNGGTTPSTTTYTASSTYSSPVTLTLTSSGGSCGTAFDSKQLTVNPTPVITLPLIETICSGESTNITPVVNVESAYWWTIGTITGTFEGAPPVGGSGATIDQILSIPNNATTGSVEYIVTPTSTTGSCIGAPFLITVTVEHPAIGSFE